MPVLVLVGDQDSPQTIDDATKIARAVAGAEFAMLERAGHLLNLDVPDVFNDQVLAFLQRIMNQQSN